MEQPAATAAASETINHRSTFAGTSDSNSLTHLEENFRHILLLHNTLPLETYSSSLTYPTDSSYTDSLSESLGYNAADGRINWEEHGVPAESIQNLRCTAERMIDAGYSLECIQVYTSLRNSVIESSFNRLGIEKLSIKNIQRLEWNTLEKRIRIWIHAVNICVRVLFASERRLCEKIFKGLGKITNTDQLFMETIEDPAVQLFNFAHAISIIRPSSERLFKILDLYEILSDLLPDINTVFESTYGESIRLQAVEISSRLAQTAIAILVEFQESVLQELTINPDARAVHPLSRYVMNFINAMLGYEQTLIELIVSKPSEYWRVTIVLDIDISKFESEVSTLGLHLHRIMEILLFTLHRKSMEYKDDSLARLFMINNVHFIIQKIERLPQLREMIGDDYLERLMQKFELAATEYQNPTWERALNCLRDEGLPSFSSILLRRALRRRFKTFNSLFEEVRSTHLVPDNKLILPTVRMNYMLMKFIPAYSSFLDTYRRHIECGKHPENYIKYSVKDLEKAVMELF